MIIIMLATSTDGARHLARFAATCRKFRQYAYNYRVLKVVSFRHFNSTDAYTRHHHPCDLLWVCAQHENRAAKTILAKAILYKDTWFQQMLEKINQDAADFGVPFLYYGSRLLHPHELVREFICYGSNKELLYMQCYLLRYMTLCVGFKVADAFGILDGIKEMCSQFEEPHVSNVRPFDTLGNDVLARVLSRRHHVDREKVLVIFDKLFPSV